MITDSDVERVVEIARDLPVAEGVYLDDDFALALLATVIDYQQHTTTVIRALEYFKTNRWDELRAMSDFETALIHFPTTEKATRLLVSISGATSSGDVPWSCAGSSPTSGVLT